MRLLVLIIALVVPLAATGQPAQPGRLTFVTLAVGASSGGTFNTGNPLGLALPSVAADLHVVRNAFHAQAGASFQGGYGIPDLILEGHLLAGVAQTVGPAVLTVSAGPSLAHVERDTPRSSMQERADSVILGLYASVGAAVVVVPEVGVGIEAFGHLNARMPIAGLRLTAALGRLPRSVVR